MTDKLKIILILITNEIDFEISSSQVDPVKKRVSFMPGQ